MPFALCRLLLVALVALWRCSASPARAHEMSMAEMEVRETSPGEFLWRWSAASDKRPMGRRPRAALARPLHGRPRMPCTAAATASRARWRWRASASATPLPW